MSLQRSNRRGQDQPARGGRVRRVAEQSPGRRGPPAGAGGGRPGRGPGGGLPVRAVHAGGDRDQPGPGEPGSAEPGARVAAARGARRLVDGNVRAGGPGVGEGRSGGPTPLPRRPAGDPRSPLCRRTGRLRPGAQTAQRSAQVRERRPHRRGGAGHAGCLGHPSDPVRRGAASRPPRPGRRDPTAGGQRYAAVADGDGRTGMEYRSSLGADLPPAPDPDGLAEAMRVVLAQSRRAELERGVSLVGPHRDELVLSVGGLPARGYASHGESWALALALRLASYQLLGAGGADPVLLLDDVFAELDSGRRERLAELVLPAEQVLVTAAVAEDVPKQLQERRYRVGGGTVTRVE